MVWRDMRTGQVYFSHRDAVAAYSAGAVILCKRDGDPDSKGLLWVHDKKGDN